MAVPMAPTAVHRSLEGYLTSQGLSVMQNDPEKRVISSSAISLNHDELLKSIPPSAQELVPDNAAGKYFVTFRTNGTGALASSNVKVSVRILVLTSQDLDSPLGGRIVSSNGALEQRQLNALTSLFNLK